jgi:hypothetical protein
MIHSRSVLLETPITAYGWQVKTSLAAYIATIHQKMANGPPVFLTFRRQKLKISLEILICMLYTIN